MYEEKPFLVSCMDVLSNSSTSTCVLQTQLFSDDPKQFLIDKRDRSFCFLSAGPLTLKY